MLTIFNDPFKKDSSHNAFPYLKRQSIQFSQLNKKKMAHSQQSILPELETLKIEKTP